MERERGRDGKEGGRGEGGKGGKGGVMTGKNEHECVWKRKDQLRKRQGRGGGRPGEMV